MTGDAHDWQGWVGRTEVRHDVVTRGLAARFRATIDSPSTGEVAPQGIHWCLCPPDAPTAQLGSDGHPIRSGNASSFLPAIPLPRRMWASSKVEFVAPFHIGSAIKRTSTIASIVDKTGSSGRLIFVTIAHDTIGDGELCVREEQTLVYRDASTTAAAFLAPRSGAAQIDAGQWPHSRALTPSEALLLRYSALTFNAHRIHYDLPYARDVEGYAGLVVHGPLTATLLLSHAASLVGDNRLKYFAFRGLVPAYCGEAMTLVATRDGDALTFATLGPTGTEAMRAEATL